MAGVALYLLVGLGFLVAFRGRLRTAASDTMSALAMAGFAVGIQMAVLITGTVTVLFWPAAVYGRLEKIVRRR